MAKKTEKTRSEKRISGARPEAISYRLKCAKTANGLSHFVMYGDAPKKKSLL